MILGGESGGSTGLEIVEASGTTLTAEVGKYYRYDSDVTNLAVTLPTITGVTEIQEFVLDFSTSSSASVTFTGGTIKNANSLSIIANHTYVIRLVWNGDEWIANTEVDFSGYRNIEYLESTGTQYIDTGLKANGSTTRVEMTIGTVAGKFWSFGTRTAYENKMFVFCNGGTSGETPSIALWLYYNGYTGTNITDDNGIHNIIIATNSYFDNIAFTRTAATFTTDANMIMFGNRDGNTINKGYMKIYSCKIYEGATLLRDYVPVRLGQVGYMYDKVSGNYFSNQGTGSFVLGPDI